VAEVPNVAPTVPSTSFEALGVPELLVAALRKAGVTEPFAIQAAALPDALAGRDVLGRAETGSGKTIAFAVPIAVAVSRGHHQRTPGKPAALVLVPTRELAAQVARTVGPLVEAVGCRCATIHGGVPQGPQVAALRRGAEVIVATPGRLEDLIARGHCQLTSVRTTVLDEADHMADLGFLPAVRRLLDQTPAGSQRLMFSATLDDAVSVLAARYLRHPATHAVDPPGASPARLDHYLFTVQSGDKSAVVAELASGEARSLLFTRTKYAARRLSRQLTAAGIPAVDLHADLTQSARQRNLAAFADGAVRVLVATDIAARGIHIEDVALVVHVDPPAEHKAYLHRSGRTARAGAAGAVVTIVTPDQARDVTALLRRASIRASAGAAAPGDARIATLTGPPAPRRAPSRDAAPGPATAQRPARGGERRRHQGSRSAARVHG
jgi:superfamily II DNA/RNA helicase